MRADPTYVEMNPTFHTALAQVDAFAPEWVKKIAFLAKLQFEHLLGILTLPFEVLLRHSFGVRYISLFQLCQMSCLGVLLGWVGNPFLKLFGLAVVLLTCHHYREARQWVKNKRPWRVSYFFGQPRPQIWRFIYHRLAAQGVNVEWYMHPEMIFRLWEPLLVALVGLPMLLFSPLLGGVFLAGAIALALKMHIRHQRVLAERWDRNDAIAIGRQLSELEDPTEKRGQLAPCVARLAAIPKTLELPASIEVLPEFTPAHPEKKPSNPSEPVRVECEECGRRLRINNARPGRKFRCPHCGNKSVIPAPVPAEIANPFCFQEG